MKIGNGLAIILSSLMMHSSLLHAAMIIDVSESDGDVIVSANGSINTTALTKLEGTTAGGSFTYGPGYIPEIDCALVLSKFDFFGNPNFEYYIIETSIVFSTSASFNAATIDIADSDNRIGIFSKNTAGNDWLVVTSGYISNTPITASATWSGTTITGLGLIPGTYVVTWGSDQTADSLTININGSAPTYSVGGTVSGLTGVDLTLQNNDADTLAVATDGPFTFVTELADGSDYLVTVSAQPTGQTCNVTNGSGTLAGADITDVTVTCLIQTEIIFTDGFEE